MSKSFNCLAQSSGIADTVTHLMSDAINDTLNSGVNISDHIGENIYYIDRKPVLNSSYSNHIKQIQLKKLSFNDTAALSIGCSANNGVQYFIDGYISSPFNLKNIDLEEKKFNAMYSTKDYIGFGLFGTIKHLGLELNYSISDKEFIKLKKGKYKAKVRRWELFTRYYYHRNFHHNVMFTAGRTWERELKKHRFFISQADVGIARTFYDRPTFEVENGIVKRMWLAGDFYFNFNYRLGFGKLIKPRNKIYKIYSYFGLMNFFPYQNLYYSRVYVGINLNKFIKK